MSSVTATTVNRIFNFSAGPAAIPLSVLQQAQDDLLSYKGCGMSIMEISHRSKEFEDVLARAEASARRLLNIPEDYAVLFLQGGASLQFSMLPMNLCLPGKPVDMLVTGVWSQKAQEEIQKVSPVNIAGSAEASKFRSIPSAAELTLDPNASFVHITSNNTIYGTQWREFPNTGSVPLVADMSSDILSRPLDIKQFGVVYAGAQKNLGPSGVTLVIIRKDLAERADKKLATMLQYRTHIKNTSMYNTPPTFGIYIMGLVFDWLEANGGLATMEKLNQQKAALLYDAIDGNDFYYNPVEKAARSLMNVVFRIKGDNEELEKKFVSEAKAARLNELKGHRNVGGLRASIYNAQPLEGVQALVAFMKDFAEKNG